MDEIRPQPGPQEAFLATPADIAIYGGAAGGGKTWALLAECLRHVHNPAFSAVILRRTFPEIERPGGLWDESLQLYPHVGATPRESDRDWTFPSGARVKFAHLEHEKNLGSWQGAQIPLIEFDELTTFSERMFWFLLSRNRSTCGVRPYIRASCNPDAGSWVADFIRWWIDEETGFAIPERAGVLRWFYRVAGRVEWFDSPAAAKAAHPELAAEASPKSVTFIPANIHDNAILLAKVPEYLATLLALPHIEQQRFLRGNWKITNQEGEWPPDYFLKKIWFEDWPKVLTMRVIALDPSKGKSAKAGDYSAFVQLGRDPAGGLWVDANLARRPKERIVDDGIELFRQWPAEAFGIEANAFQELLADDFARISAERAVMLPIFLINNQVPKEVRIRRIGPYLARGNIRFKANSPGAKLLVQQLQDFPNGDHDDGPDALEMALRLAIELSRGAGQAAGTREVIRPR